MRSFECWGGHTAHRTLSRQDASPSAESVARSSGGAWGWRVYRGGVTKARGLTRALWLLHLPFLRTVTHTHGRLFFNFFLFIMCSTYHPRAGAWGGLGLLPLIELPMLAPAGWCRDPPNTAPHSYTRARSTSASNPSLSLDRSTNVTASLAVPSLPIPITKLSRWVVALAHQRPSAAQFLSSLVHVSLLWSISGFGPPPLHLRGFAGPAVMDGKKARKRQTERRIVSMGSA